MTTTPQTLTLAGDDYVVIRRDEYERLRAAANEDAAGVTAIQRALDDPDQTWAPADLVRRIADGEHPLRVWRTHRGMPPARWPPPRASEPLRLGHRVPREARVGEGAPESRHRPSTCRWMISCERFDRHLDHLKAARRTR